MPTRAVDTRHPDDAERIDTQFLRRVLVVEDDVLLGELIAGNLRDAGFDVLRVGDARAARTAVEQFDPDALLLDVDLGDGATGLDLAHVLRAQVPHLSIVFLTHLADPRFAGGDLPSGPAIAYLRKQAVTSPAEVVQALNAVLSDEPSAPLRDDRQAHRPLDNLSRAQLDTLRLIASGHSNEQIAATRGTSVRAVEYLVARTFAAAGIDEASRGNRRSQAVRAFLEASGRPSPLLGADGV